MRPRAEGHPQALAGGGVWKKATRSVDDGESIGFGMLPGAEGCTSLDLARTLGSRLRESRTMAWREGQRAGTAVAPWVVRRLGVWGSIDAEGMPEAAACLGIPGADRSGFRDRGEIEVRDRGG